MNEPVETAEGAEKPRRPSFWIRFLPLLFLLAGLVLAAVGWSLRESTPPAELVAVTLQRKAGLVDLPDLNDGGGTLEFYLRIQATTGEITTVVKPGPIGNGLTWALEPSLGVDDVPEIQVWDHDFLKDDMIDRIGMTGLRSEGQAYTATLVQGPEPPRRHGSLVLFGLGGFSVLVGVLLALRRQAA
jgi:hypothetical protein